MQNRSAVIPCRTSGICCLDSHASQHICCRLTPDVEPVQSICPFGPETRPGCDARSSTRATRLACFCHFANWRVAFILEEIGRSIRRIGSAEPQGVRLSLTLRNSDQHFSEADPFTCCAAGLSSARTAAHFFSNALLYATVHETLQDLRASLRCL